MTSQEISFSEEGQILDGQIEIQNEGYIQMTSDAMAASMDPQIQYIGEQQMGSVEMNGQQMLIMQTEVNGEEQLYTQGGTYMQMTSQGIVMNEETCQMQSQDLSQQFMLDGQIGQGQQLIIGENSGQIVEGGFQMQGTSMEGDGIIMQGVAVDQIQMQQMSIQGEGITYLGGGVVEGEQFQLSEMSAGEMSLDMNAQQLQTQEVSVQGEGVIYLEGVIEGEQLQGTEMSLGEQAQMVMQNQEIGFAEGGEFQTSEISFQENAIVEEGAIHEQQFQMGNMSMTQMPLELNGQEIQIQEMPLEMQSQKIAIGEEAEFQTSEISVQEVPFVEGGEIQEQQFQMNETAISEMPLEMNVEGIQIQEMPLEMQSQEIGTVEGGALLTSEIIVQQVGFMGGEIQGQQFQMSEIAMSEMPLEQDEQIQEMTTHEMPLEMQSQEVGTVEGGALQTSEMSVSEVGFIVGGEIRGQQLQTSETSMTEMPFEMNAQGIQMQEMPLEMQSQEIDIVKGAEFQNGEMSVQEVGFVERNEIQGQQLQMSEISMSEMPLEKNVQGVQMQEMTTQEMPLGMQIQEICTVEGGELTSEVTVQEVGCVKGGEIQEQQFQISETSMSQMPLEMNGQGIQMKELTIQEMPLEMQSQEISIVEDADFQSGEISVQEVGFVEGGEIQEQQFQISETSMSQMPFEMKEQGAQMQELRMQEMPLEMKSQEIAIAEGAEFQNGETSVQGVGFVEGGEIQEHQLQMGETSMSEMPTKMTGQVIQIQEMPLEIQSQEIAITEAGDIQNSEISSHEVELVEGGEIQEQQEMPLEVKSQEIHMSEGETGQTDGLKIAETTYQEIPFDSQETQMQEMSIQKTTEELPIQATSIQQTRVQGISVHEMSAREIPAHEMIIQEKAMQETPLKTDETNILKEEKMHEIASKTPWHELQSKEKGGDQAEKIGVEQFQATEEPLQEMPLDINQQHMQEMSPQEMLLESQHEALYISTAGMTAQEMPLGNTSQELPISKKASQGSDANIGEARKKVETTNKTSETIPSEDPKEDELQEQLSCKDTKNGIETHGIVCDHDLLIDQFLERISRLEKDKEYLQERYEEIRQEKGMIFTSHEDQLATRDEHQHCCNIVKDYSSLINYITSPREGISQDRSDGRCYVHNHSCFTESERQNSQYLDETPADYAYYKSKCEQIKREKDRLQRAYETEKRQKEDIEREYQNENDEKAYLEERYQEMLDNIQRFDETIRSLRRDNERLQKNLNDWANTRIMTQTPDIDRMALEQKGGGAGIAEYKRSIEALEKENNEFRTILEVLNKKNENQQTLKNIEIGLARENELIQVKKDRARLESSLKDLKRTNKHQQERIEEIRKDSSVEITRLKENYRKLERSLKENVRLLEEKDEAITSIKKRHSEEMQGIQIKLHTEFSASLLSKNKIKDLQSKIERLEEDRKRLREDLRASSVNTKHRLAEVDKEYQDIEFIHQRYEEERRNKMRLASDIKCLLGDIMELKERNQRLQEDFHRERMEIKGMLEKQATEITEEYLAQIKKLQRSLVEETKRRKETQAGSYGLISNQDNGGHLIGGQRGFNGTASWGNTELQIQLNNEIQQRETLEIENKTLLYKINDILCSGGQGEGERENRHNEDTLYSGRNKLPHLTQNNTTNTSRERQVNDNGHRELEGEIEELKEKIDDLKKEVKRNKDLKRKNEELEEEVTHLSRKRDELLAAQRNLTREVDHLSRTLDEVERRNRKLSNETERFTRKIQDIEESFRHEKMSLARSFESDKSRAVEEVTKLKETCEKKLRVQIDTTRRLEEKILQLEEKMPPTVYVQTGSLEKSSLPNDSHSYTLLENERSQSVNTYSDNLKLEVKRLEAIVREVNNKHADDLRNLEIQKERMSEEFKKEKQSLENFFQKEKEGLKRRLRDAESKISGDGVITYQDLGEKESPGRRSPIGRGLEAIDDGLVNYRGKATEGDSEHTIQDMRRKYNDEKNAILNRASKEKSELEDEVRELKQKLTRYRRQTDDELDDLKKKHRKELDYLNEQLSKERAEYEEKLRTNRNISNTKIGQLPRNSQNSLEEDNEGRGEKSLKEELEKQISVMTSKFEKEKSNLQNDKRKLMDTIHALTREMNVLKCYKRESKNCYKQEIEKLSRVHEVEKITIIQRASRDKEEETTRIKMDFEERLSLERKKLQSIIDDLRRKILVEERKVKDMEVQQKNEKVMWDKEKAATERILNQSREELKITLEREYSKMLNREKQKSEETVKALTTQISFLQNQRKEIQTKLVNNEFSGNCKLNTEQLARSRMVIEMEQEYLERSDRERRPMEDKIKGLQREVSKLQREKTELKATLENEKQELEEDLERMQSDMRRKLSKAREEMERRTDALSKNLVATKEKSVLVSKTTKFQEKVGIAKHIHPLLHVIIPDNDKPLLTIAPGGWIYFSMVFIRSGLILYRSIPNFAWFCTAPLSVYCN